MMNPLSNTQRVHPGLLAGLALLFSCISGCAEPGDREPRQGDRTDGDDKGVRTESVEGHTNADVNSADYLLCHDDYDKFRPGRPKDDVLDDVQRRGNLEMAAEHKGSRICAISYGIFGGPFSNDPRGDIIWAVFVDGKFQKFVRWPEWGDKQIKLGDFSRLVRALNSEPVSISDLENAKEGSSTLPSQTDPGLTATWLLLRENVEASRKRELKKNAELRDQFNASRLKLGMTESEVESVLKAKPIEAGEIGTGSFRIYGSAESLDVLPYLHYSNILTIFSGGKLSGVYSGYTVSGGERWRQELRESFVELPLSKLDARDNNSDENPP